jgi:hypothetical protein
MVSSRAELIHHSGRRGFQKPKTAIRERVTGPKSTSPERLYSRRTQNEARKRVEIRLIRKGNGSALPLPPNSGLPEFGILNCRSRIYPTSSGPRRAKLALIPTAAAIDSLRHPRVSATALIAGGASEASLEGCQHAGTRDRPSRPAQERGHLRMTVTVWCRWY